MTASRISARHRRSSPPSAFRKVRGAAVKIRWNLVEQAMSSLAMALVSVLVARVVSASAFGHFALAIALYLFLLGVLQAVVNQPFLMRCSALSDADAREAVRGATGLAVAVGLACVVVLVPLGLVLGGGVGWTLAAMAVVTPGLFLQEAWRSVFVARRRARSAAANTAVRIGFQIGALVVAIVAGQRDPAVLMVVWGLAVWPAALGGARAAGAFPRLNEAAAFLRAHRDVSRFMVVEWGIVLGAAQAALFAVAGLGSTADVGALRGAQTLLGPLSVLGLGLFGFLVPELVRRPDMTIRTRAAIAAVVGIALSLIALVWGGVLLLLPAQAGASVLGATWPETRSVLAAMVLWSAGTVASTGVNAVLRSIGDVRSTLVVNATVGVAVLVGAVSGQLIGGVQGAAWGFAAATVLTTPLWWFRMFRSIGRHLQAAPA